MSKNFKIINNYLVGLLTIGAIIAIIIFVLPENKLDSNDKLNENISNNKKSLNLNSESYTFENKEYGFSVNYNSDFSYFEDSTLGDAIKSYTFKKFNSNTREEVNRDTPNGFNTSADDVMGLNIYENRNQLDVNNIEGFRLWYDQDNISPSSGITGIPTVEKIGDNMVIEAILADGIYSFSRAIFFFNKNYIVEISSSDISKDELYDIANSFKFDNKK